MSIVVVCLNEEDQIGQLLDSLGEQTYRPLEILVVDGGSRDATRSIVEERTRREGADVSIRLMEESGPVRSPANARNQGIEASKGECLILLDADFYMVDDRFVHDVVRGLEERKAARVRAVCRPETPVEAHFADAFHGRAMVAFRREVFDRHRYRPDLGYGEDEHLWRSAGIPDDNLCDATIGIHLYQTWKEYAASMRWYGRTLLPFLRTMRRDFPHLFWRETVPKHVIHRLPAALFYTLMLPLSVVVAFWWPWALVVGPAAVGATLLRRWSVRKPRGRFRDLAAELLIGNAAYFHGLLQGLLRARPSRD